MGSRAQIVLTFAHPCLLSSATAVQPSDVKANSHPHRGTRREGLTEIHITGSPLKVKRFQNDGTGIYYGLWSCRVYATVKFYVLIFTLLLFRFVSFCVCVVVCLFFCLFGCFLIVFSNSLDSNNDSRTFSGNTMAYLSCVFSFSQA